MILLSYGFTFAVGLAVIILLIAAVTAIWERLRDKGELKKLEREQRRENH
jgi:heme exporter protein D